MKRQPKRFIYERQLAEQYVAAHLAYMGADVGTPEFSATRDAYHDMAKRLAHMAVAVLLGGKVAKAASLAADVAHDAAMERHRAKVAARDAARQAEFAAQLTAAAAPQPEACV